MRSLTRQELQDLIDGGNDFARAIAAQCLAAEQTIKEISELPDDWRKKHTYFADICANELQAILNRRKS